MDTAEARRGRAMLHCQAPAAQYVSRVNDARHRRSAAMRVSRCTCITRVMQDSAAFAERLRSAPWHENRSLTRRIARKHEEWTAMKFIVSYLAIAAVASGYALSLLAPSIASAGQTTGSYVTVSGNSASGNVFWTRRSPDSVQYIGCRSDPFSSGPLVGCYARNAAGVRLSCFTQSASSAVAVAAVGEYSHISFTASGGTCVQINITNASSYLP